VRLFGEAPEALRDRWRVGYVPQRPVVVDQLPATVEEVVASGCVARRGWARRPRKEDHGRVERALAVVALEELRRTPIVELSGGQQQRAFIARALASEPELLVLDEPIAGVDAESQSRFRDALVTRCNADGVAVLLVSHELGAVADDLDRLVLLRGGRVAFDGPPSDLEGVSLGVHEHDLPMWLEGHG
jgi:zinc transport system ATP-binding protein